jgi:hypothetical protein
MQVLGDERLARRYAARDLTAGVELGAVLKRAGRSFPLGFVGRLDGRLLALGRAEGGRRGGLRDGRVCRSTHHLVFGEIGTEDRDFGKQELALDDRRVGVVEDGPDGDLWDQLLLRAVLSMMECFSSMELEFPYNCD